MFEKIKTWLSPLVTALLGLVTATTLYLNNGRDIRAELIHADFDKRLTIVERQTDQIQPLVKQLTDLNLRLTELVVKMDLLHNKAPNRYED